MSDARVGWALLAVWTAWIYALTGWLSAEADVARWLPDLGLVLLFALGARLSPVRLVRASFVVALARIALTVDPPIAVLAAYVGAALLFVGARGLVNLDDLVSRALLAGVAALLVGTWWSLVFAVRHPDLAVALAPSAAWRAALTTTAAALASPWLLRLPGLRLLWRGA